MKKVILITGASSGMGHAAAARLATEGHIVYAASPRAEEMHDLKALGVHTMKMDVTREDDVQRVVDIIVKNEGRIDVLYNNAGYGLGGSIEEVPIAEAKKEFDVNVFGLATVTQKVVPHMREARKGLIINTSSMGGIIYTPMGGWYHGSKFAVEGLSDCLRLELQQFSINVVVLEPGYIKTNFNNVALKSIGKYSGSGPYAALVRKLEKASTQGFEGATDPSVVAAKISEIVAAKTPKTRYQIGRFAKPMIWLRRHLSDRQFDWVMMR